MKKASQHLRIVFLTARARLATARVRVVWGVQTAFQSIKKGKNLNIYQVWLVTARARLATARVKLVG